MHVANIFSLLQGKKDYFKSFKLKYTDNKTRVLLQTLFTTIFSL